MIHSDNAGLKATAIAPSNIAFIKYWGKKDEQLRLPSNGSVSVNLSNLLTTTTVEFRKDLKKDEITVNGKRDVKKAERVSEHLDRIRKIAKIPYKANVASQNNFPTASGLASSASGFAALTLAGVKAAGLNLSEKELTILARVGSGSACRSIPDGYVEWLEGDSNESSYAESILTSDYWKIAIVAVIVGEEKKVSSVQGHKAVEESPFFTPRLKKLKQKIVAVKEYLKNRDFTKFGLLIEKEALELHALTLTSYPPVIYWQPETVKLIKLIQNWRDWGLEFYFSIDAGPNVFIFSREEKLPDLLNKLKENQFNNFIVNKPARGTRLINTHLL